MNKVIGISGVAGAGKDTFFELLSERIPCERYSLADELKREVSQWCRMHYQIDSVHCLRKHKEVIRPFLVFHGTTKRSQTEGRYWIDKLNDTVIKGDDSKFKIITDIRYDDYDNDEVSWLKNELNGTLVHISQYTQRPDTSLHDSPWITREYKPPVNSEEARNDPKIKKKSDFQIEWEFIKNGQIEELGPYVDNFVTWLTKGHEKETNQGLDLNKESQEGRV